MTTGRDRTLWMHLDAATVDVFARASRRARRANTLIGLPREDEVRHALSDAMGRYREAPVDPALAARIETAIADVFLRAVRRSRRTRTLIGLPSEGEVRAALAEQFRS